MEEGRDCCSVLRRSIGVVISLRFLKSVTEVTGGVEGHMQEVRNTAKGEGEGKGGGRERNEVKTPLADPAAVICAKVGSASGDERRMRFMAYL